MEKRLRSPNYPALSLPDAIDRVAALYRAQHTHAAPREIVAKGMGYNSLNGASASAISALHKYGLLGRAGDEIKVSDRAMRILHPHSPAERAKAIQEAAYDPPLFAELRERFPGQMPSDELLRNYLIRNGFAPAALTPVMLAYRETSEIAEREGYAHDSPREQQALEHAAMPSQQVHSGAADFAGERHMSVGSPPPASQTQPQQGPVIAMMEDYFIVNMVVRSRAKARLLKHMIDMAEGMLPEEDNPAPVSASGAEAAVTETIAASDDVESGNP
jgi:hypothetical protein